MSSDGDGMFSESENENYDKIYGNSIFSDSDDDTEDDSTEKMDVIENTLIIDPDSSDDEDDIGGSATSMRAKIETNMQKLKNLSDINIPIEHDKFDHPESTNLYEHTPPPPKNTDEEDVQELDLLKGLFLHNRETCIQELVKLRGKNFTTKEDVYKEYKDHGSNKSDLKLSRDKDNNITVSYRNGFYYQLDTNNKIILNLSKEAIPLTYVYKEITDESDLNNFSRSNSINSISCADFNPQMIRINIINQ